MKFDLVARRKVRNIILADNIKSLQTVQAAFDDLQVWDRALSSSEVKDLVRIDCEWSGWSEWSDCTSVSKPGNTYNFAVRVRTRKITLQPKHGGLECPSSLKRGKGVPSYDRSVIIHTLCILVTMPYHHHIYGTYNTK